MLPWWAWVLLASAAALAVTVASSYAVLRATESGRRFLNLSRRGKVRFGRALLRDPAVPRRAKWIIPALVLYLALPFDLIPDPLPVVGQLDDVLVVVVAIALLILLTPRDALDRAIRAGEAYDASRHAARAPDGSIRPR